MAIFNSYVKLPEGIYFCSIRQRMRKVYPEVEYIEYDVEEMGEPCYIEPHVDNKSAVPRQ